METWSRRAGLAVAVTASCVMLVVDAGTVGAAPSPTPDAPSSSSSSSGGQGKRLPGKSYTETVGPVRSVPVSAGPHGEPLQPRQDSPRLRSLAAPQTVSCVSSRSSICENGYGRGITVTETDTGKVVGVWSTEESIVSVIY